MNVLPINHIWPDTTATCKLIFNHKNNIWEQKFQCLNLEYKYSVYNFKNS